MSAKDVTLEVADVPVVVDQYSQRYVAGMEIDHSPSYGLFYRPPAGVGQGSCAH